ncbi:hypothetical protein TRFO_07826 [Tritrichomonas foetus]|uniref:60S ribosomal export protein NMD3 n=1 Tax=Tritrichomonas foetus TaxID=1144522 RepID=A0A1J4JPZ1_9EUKA|nr:hypothetical protein TRFO_07826 [Tritrichomonas foetus]|eukprot:OHT00826.1 hypothetical protein TRFO_07826 [Tritrichomonas foetus]
MDTCKATFPPETLHIHQCKNCNRYLNQNGQWIPILFDTPEFVDFCVCCLGHGFDTSNIQIERANMIYSSSTSHSFSISLSFYENNNHIQKVVWFQIDDQICDLCNLYLSSQQIQQWTATIKIEAYSNRTRPLQWLKETIEKECTAIKAAIYSHFEKDSLLYQFNSKSTAFRVVSFIKRTIAVKIEETNDRIMKENGEFDFNLTYAISLPGIWLDDLVAVPEQLFTSLNKGGDQLCICSDISENIILIDPSTGAQAEIPAEEYWKEPFSAVKMRSSMRPFNVVDVTTFGPKCGRLQMCDLTLIPSSYSVNNKINKIHHNHNFNKVIMSNNDNNIYVKSHLGADLRPGDFCLGYDLRECNFDDIDVNPPEAIIVRKVDGSQIDRNYIMLEYLMDGVDEEVIQESLTPPVEAPIQEGNLDLNLQKLVI